MFTGNNKSPPRSPRSSSRHGGTSYSLTVLAVSLTFLGFLLHSYWIQPAVSSSSSKKIAEVKADEELLLLSDEELQAEMEFQARGEIISSQRKTHHPCLPISPEEKVFYSKIHHQYLNETTTNAWKKQITFMVLGCAKCGTTSTYEYLVQHPRVVRPNDKETHCFFENWDPSDPDCTKWYDVEWLSARPDRVSGDFTPEYLYRSEMVMERIRTSFPWVQLVAILRNPTDRVYSHHAMQVKNGVVSDASIQDRVISDLNDMRAMGILPYWKFPDPDNKKVMTMEDWSSAEIDMDEFEKFYGSEQERDNWMQFQYLPYPNGNVARGVYVLQLRQWMIQFPCERFLVLKTDEYTVKGGVEKNMRLLHNHLGLEYVPPSNTEPKNTRKHEEDPNDPLRMLLNRFFKPYNDKLYLILGDDWKDPW